MDVAINFLAWVAVQVGIFVVATLASPATPPQQHPGDELKPPVAIEIKIERAPAEQQQGT